MGAPALAPAATPNDPQLADVWTASASGPPSLPTAWQRSTGAGVTVAVVDSGLDLGQRDFRNSLWTNSKEIAGNGVDDDQDGFVDDVHGASILHRDGNPTDRDGHGTYVAGIIGARGNDGAGIAGVAWRARVMPVAVLGPGARGSVADVAEGISYAVARGARIINVSINTSQETPELKEAIAGAERAGALIIASAGNDGANRDAHPSYPASDPSPNVISVAAVDADLVLAPFSGHGSHSVDIAAPGVDIVSTARGGGLEARSGTTAAAAYVSGVAALVLSASPRMTAAQLRAAVLDGAHRMRSLSGDVGAGVLDAAGALTKAIGPAPVKAKAAVARAKPVHPSRHHKAHKVRHTTKPKAKKHPKKKKKHKKKKHKKKQHKTKR